jgi:hypothetical protein
MRQTSKLLTTSLATANRELTNQVTGLLASDREALRVFWTGIADRAAMEELDRQHFDALISLYFEALLQSYQQGYEAGLGRADWMLSRPGICQYWGEYGNVAMYEEGFCSYISDRINVLNKSVG